MQFWTHNYTLNDEVQDNIKNKSKLKNLQRNCKNINETISVYEKLLPQQIGSDK